MSTSPRRPTPEWTLTEALGSRERLEQIVTSLYDRLYDDLFVGFFFTPHDKQTLIAHQTSYLLAHLGKRSGDTPAYTGRSMREAHAHLPILTGHFDRRHVILREVLEAHQVEEPVRSAWLALDQSLRPLIVRQGAKRREALLSKEEE